MKASEWVRIALERMIICPECQGSELIIADETETEFSWFCEVCEYYSNHPKDWKGDEDETK